MSNVELGRHAETIASSFLKLNGYSVIARNYRYRRNELDIVAQRDDCLVLVEVKYRSGPGRGLPREAVGRQKMRGIIRAARGYLAEHGLRSTRVRFDVIEVRLEAGGSGLAVRHIVGAFGADYRGW